MRICGTASPRRRPKSCHKYQEPLFRSRPNGSGKLIWKISEWPQRRCSDHTEKTPPKPGLGRAADSLTLRGQDRIAFLGQACISAGLVYVASMTLKDARTRHSELCDNIRKHDHHYYMLGRPLLSDTAYDALRYELRDLENRFPELITPESPSQHGRTEVDRDHGQSVQEASAAMHTTTPFTMPDLSGDLSKLSEADLQATVEKCQLIKKKDFRQLLEDEALGRPAHDGFIYVLSNPSLPGLLKIGFTAGPVDKRVRQLNNTSVPQRFKIEFSLPVYDGLRVVEKKVHTALEIYREQLDREFFRISVKEARLLIEAALHRSAKPRAEQTKRG